MATTALTPHRAPRSRDGVAARRWATVTVLAVPVAIAAADGLATLLGVPEGGLAPPGVATAVLGCVAALVLLPLGAAWRRGRGAERSGDHGAFPLLVVATAVGGGFVVLAALSWLVRIAGWAIDRL